MEIKCKEVWIRFKSPNIQGQRIMHSDYSGTHHLEVQSFNEASFVTVDYVSKENRIIKTLAFSTDAIQEISMETDVDRIK